MSSLLDKLSRKDKWERQKEKIKKERDQLEKDRIQFHEDAEKRRKRDAYNLKWREDELLKDKKRLEKKQAEAREEAEEKAEKKRRKDGDYLESVIREIAEKLEESETSHEQELKHLQAIRIHDDREAQATLDREIAREKQRGKEEIQQLRRQLEASEKARQDEEDKQRRLKQKQEAKRKEAERAKEEEEERFLQAEKKRQQDELVNHNTTKALQKLRELIRERYELDMEIYRLRCITPANRPKVQKRMDKSDELLQEIRSIVDSWDQKSFDELEWTYAEQVKERLLADGKRIWAVDPPWPTGRRKAPIINPSLSLGGGGRLPPMGNRRVASGSRTQE